MIKAVFECVGMSYHLDALEEMKEQNEDYFLPKKKMEDAYGDDHVYANEYNGYLTVEQEPTNEADPNAVRVAYKGQTIAYIKKEEAARAAELLLAGYPYKAVAEGGEYKAVEDDQVITGEDPISVTVIFQDAEQHAAPEQSPKRKAIFLVLGILLIVLSLLLLIISPIAGAVGIVFGIVLLIYWRRT